MKKYVVRQNNFGSAWWKDQYLVYKDGESYFTRDFNEATGFATRKEASTRIWHLKRKSFIYHNTNNSELDIMEIGSEV